MAFHGGQEEVLQETQEEQETRRPPVHRADRPPARAGRGLRPPVCYRRGEREEQGRICACIMYTKDYAHKDLAILHSMIYTCKYICRYTCIYIYIYIY